MKELRIFDQRKNMKAIIGLNKLVEVINNLDSSILNGAWTVYQGANGYGEYVCWLEDLLEDKECIEIEAIALFNILLEGKQYFYHLQMKKKENNIEIGVFDSTYLYFKCNDLNFINSVKSNFIETKILDSE